MTGFDDLAFLDATAQAELVARGQVQPAELVEAAIARIERFNPRLNAVVTTVYEEARRAAALPLPNGPFAGVPFLLKDSIAALAGVRMTSGSRLLQEQVPVHDSELAARLKRAGLIVLGKTNMSEFGLLPTTESLLFGPSRNPWDAGRTPGGSSGGAAAAVAAAMVAMAHGGDGGGSIRIPASCCGVFGLKPTRARNPLGPDYGDLNCGLTVEHAVTRSVRDSAALLDATCGPDVGDPYWAPPRVRPFAEEVGADPGRLRVAYLAKPPVPVHADCMHAVHDAAALCGSLGHEVIDAAPDFDHESATQLFVTLWAAGCASTIDAIAAKAGTPPRAERVEPLTWALYETGKRVGAADYLLAVRGLQALARRIAKFFVSYDVWLTPVVAEPPPPLGYFNSLPGNPLAGFSRAQAFAPFTGICNFTGQPGMSVPLCWNAQGLPIGTQVIGRFGDEATLFRLAAQLEQARPWAGRRPVVCP